nr:DNA mismatch repair protein MutS [Peptoniphilus raoultii]
MMKQYLETKEKYPDSILFFRLGDFYEMFFDDAILASKELEIALTKRDAGFAQKAPMCGIPYHVSDSYISKLINKGYKVTICDQIEDPKLANGLVKRAVTKIVTPGTFTDNEYLRGDENNYLMSIYIEDYKIFISYTDFSTGELYYTSKTALNKEKLYLFLRDEIYKIMPSEILINDYEKKIFKKFISEDFCINTYSNKEIDKIDIYDLAKNNLLKESFDKFKELGLRTNKSLILLIDYLATTQKIHLNHINNFIYYYNDNNLILDENSKRNLEIIKGLNSGNKKGSLLEILDKCKTSMGSRLLKKWLSSPLTDIEKITLREDFIENLNEDLLLSSDLGECLKGIYDIERLSIKITNKTINPKEINALKYTITLALKIKNLLNIEDKKLKLLADKIEDLSEISNTIEEILIEDPPAIIEDQRIIKKGYSNEIDEIFEAKEDGKNWILNLEMEERERTGIKNLKIKYNKILGYFIEITKSNLDQVPDDYIRKQTLVTNERYFSIKLKNMESKIIMSKDKAEELQLQILNSLKDMLLRNIVRIQNLAISISEIDCLYSLSEVSRLNNYKRPRLNKKGIIEIIGGRHPIVEENFKGELFVPNDTYLDLEDNMILIITGPNMAGKSTYMRQVALIAIMAHIGSFVPCDSANISILDRVFTRIGASDNLAMGQSTFMVEMKEVANITENATSKSLLILDEVGRGTSTYDGLSLAYAILEYIASELKAKTLFATHYHELCALANAYKCISNLTIAVKKEEDKIIFLRKIIEGYSNHSYGIDVARLAGINENIIERSKEILSSLEKNSIDKKNFEINKVEDHHILKSNPKRDKFIGEIQKLDINNISPMTAFSILNELIEKSKEV